MANDVRLYSFPISPYAAKVRAVLRHKEIPFRETFVHPLARREIRRKSGQALLPVLEHGERVVADSTRIIAYLEETFPERPVYPADPVLRARARLLEEWADEGLPAVVDPVRWLIPLNRPRLMAEFSRAYASAVGQKLLFSVIERAIVLVKGRRYGFSRGLGTSGRRLGRLAEVLDYVDGAISPSGFLVGDEPTVADFSVAAWVAALRGLDGWETVKMRRKVVKLAKLLIPEEESAPATVAASAPPQTRDARDQEAYDATDQAFIEASRLRRAAKGP